MSLLGCEMLKALPGAMFLVCGSIAIKSGVGALLRWPMFVSALLLAIGLSIAWSFFLWALRLINEQILANRNPPEG